MSRIGGNPVKSPQDEMYVLAGRILGGSGVATIKSGVGFSVKYISAGRYQIIPDVNFPYFAGAVATLYQSGANYFTVKLLAYVVAAGSGTVASVDFGVANAGTLTDLGAAEELNFHITYGRSGKP